MAQDDDLDIDSIIEDVGQDFQFGGRDDVKQQNLTTANETNREDVKIEEEEERERQEQQTTTTTTTTTTTPPPNPMVDVSLDMEDILGGSMNVSLVGGGTLASNVSLNLVSTTIQLAPGSSHTVSINCPGSCGYWLFFTKGAVFDSPPVFDGCFTGTITYSFQVNADNSGLTNTNPGAPGPGGC